MCFSYDASLQNKQAYRESIYDVFAKYPLKIEVIQVFQFEL